MNFISSKGLQEKLHAAKNKCNHINRMPQPENNAKTQSEQSEQSLKQKK